MLTIINSGALLSPCVTLKVLECNAKVLSILFSLLHCLLRMSKPIPVFQSSGSCFLDWSTNLNQRFVALVSFLLSVFCCCCPGRRNMSWLLKNLSRTEKSQPCSRVLSRHGSSLGFNCCCLKLKKSKVLMGTTSQNSKKEFLRAKLILKINSTFPYVKFTLGGTNFWLSRKI